MTEFKNGSVKISNDIIDQLIAEIALQVEGVDYVLGYKNKKVEKNKKEGIVSVINDNKIDIALTVVIKEEADIYKICENVQNNIKEQINVMLGLDVEKVNVIVKSLV